MPTPTEIAQFFAPITQNIGNSSYVSININESKLIQGQVVQDVFWSERNKTPAMNVQIFGLKEFVIANAPTSSYVLPIASASVLGGIKVGSGLSIAGDGTLSASGGGSVASVGVNNLSPLFTASVANPTTTPVISFTQVSQTQNLVFASPNGSSGNPTFRALVASDIPSLNYVTALTAGTGISIGGTSAIPIVTNTAPDQTVILTAGSGIVVTGTYPNFTITNSSPSSGGTVTSVAMSVPTGLSISGSPITSSGTLALSFTAGYSIPTTASQTNWDTAYTNRITSANAPLSIASNIISISQATTSTDGYLSSTDWNAFNNKGSGTVTGTGASGRVAFWSGTSAVSSDTAFLWDNTNKRLTIGTSTPTYTEYLNLSGTTNGTIRMAVTNLNTGTSAATGLILVDSVNTRYGTFFRGNNSNTGTVIGTSIGYANNLLLTSASGGGDGTAPITLVGSRNYLVGGRTATNFGLVNDSVGIRVDTINNLTTTNANPFTVNGASYFGGNATATSTVHIGGSLALPIVAKTANYTLVSTDHTVTFNGTSLTATLPTASTCNGRIYCIINYNATALTISSFQNLANAATTSISVGVGVKLQSDGTNWRQIP